MADRYSRLLYGAIQMFQKDNIESPSTYANKAYKEYRKKEKSKDTSSPFDRIRQN
jgi:hypothetical protein